MEEEKKEGMEEGRNKVNILVIEDSEFLLSYIKEFLEKKGFFIYTSNNGFHGITYYETLRPDLVITNILMPDMDGLEVIIKLKKKYPECKIIAMSAGGRIISEDYLVHAKVLGACGTIRKPLDMNLLLKEIYKNLS